MAVPLNPQLANEALFKLRRTRAPERRFWEPATPEIPKNNLLFIGALFSRWHVGYNSRRNALQYIVDTPARDLLVGRHRDSNARYQTMPDVPKEHLDYISVCLADARKHGLDVATLVDIPSYGRSFLDLWTEARTLRLSDKQTLAHFWRWQYARPPHGTGPIPRTPV